MDETPTDESVADVVDADAKSPEDNSTSSKPLKSILKRRKPDDVPEEPCEKIEKTEVVEPSVKIPKVGSITAALKMLTKIPGDSDEECNDSDPKPSAFIQEMEKQKAQNGLSVSGIPHKGQNALTMQSSIVPLPSQIQKTNTTPRRPATRLTHHDEAIEGVVIITNLPFKVTSTEVLSMLGIWPKGGNDGIRLTTDENALPTGYGYVIVERHMDMMELIRLSGVEWQGRKLHCALSSRESLVRDWKITKKAKAEMKKSRVIQVKRLSYIIEKKELIEALNVVKFAEKDIYWSPLRSNQTNSGRGFIILSSSEDARKVHSLAFMAHPRPIEVMQVHPSDLRKFCTQCKLELDENVRLLDDLEGNYDDVSELKLDFTKPDCAKPGSISAELREAAMSVRVSSSGNSRKPQSSSSSHDKRQRPPNNHPNFTPSIFVRLFNVPEKATTADIRSFFEPVLPAKIAQNIGYDIWDVQFYAPDDAMRAMTKHNLMIRKNAIQLQMLPGPPQPLPPRQMPPRQMPPGQIPPQYMPPAMQMMMPPHPGQMPPAHIPPPGMFPPMMPPGFPPIGPGLPPIAPPRMHHTMPPLHLPPPMHGFPPSSDRKYSESGRRSPRTAYDSAPPPMYDRGKFDRSRSRSKERVEYISSYSRRDEPRSRRTSSGKQRSPDVEKAPPPKKELIPVPPLPDDFTKYRMPKFDGNTPVGQAMICPMQGFFCQLCNKFYSSRTSAKEGHCKSRGHYDKLKQVLQEKKRLRRLAETEHAAKRR